MIYIGNHLSSAGGYLAMGNAAINLNGDTFAYFTRNPRGGKAKAPDARDAEALAALLKEKNFGKLVAHAPYTMNLCSDRADIRRFAGDVLADDLSKTALLPGHFYNFHPGSHVGQGIETGIALIAEALNGALNEQTAATVLLETMAGKGSEVGGRFEELREIIDRTEHSEKLGVCLDTCHVWDAGYDIVNDPDGVLSAFDRIIGFSRLKAVHLNDSMNVLGSRKDRHEKLGLGKIGADALRRLVRHPALQDKPFILETPNDDEGYAREIALVREWMV